MAEEVNSYTQKLSKATDSAYETYKAGEPNSDKQLYKAFRTQARSRIWSRLAKPDAELEHDIATRAIRALPKFKGKSRLSTWFFRIVENEIARELRKRIGERKRIVSLEIGGLRTG
jgi:DNA-directed RNA polymerase specialized sigma24 family protein